MKKFLTVLAVIMLLVSVAVPTAAMAGKDDDNKILRMPRVEVAGEMVGTSASIDVYDGDVITLVDGNSYIVEAGATVTFRMEKGASALTDVELLCNEGVTLTIENLNIDLSANGDMPLLGFLGLGNKLILVGDNTLIGSYYTPAVLVEIGTELTISGEGKLTAIGGDADFDGSGGAGIGGADGVVFLVDCGRVVIEGGTITAIGGVEAAGIGGGGYGDFGDVVAPAGGPEVSGIIGGLGGNGGNVEILGNAIVYAMGGADADDIGGGFASSLAGSLLIDNDSVLFAYRALLPSAIVTSGNHSIQGPALQPIIDVYGPLPASWGGTSDIVFFVDYNVLYESNGGKGTTEDPGRPYTGGSTTAMANGFVRSGYKFVGWNTKSDGSGTAYDPGDTVPVPAEGVRLYAMWEITANPRTGEAGSFAIAGILIAVMALMVVGFVVRRKVAAKE